MDVLVELFVATVVALAAAVFAHLGVPMGDADDGGARSVRRSPAAIAAPAPERMITRISEECDERKVVGKAVIHAEVEAVVDEPRIEAAIETALAQAEKDVDAALMAADRAQAWAEREAERAEALAERAEALAERRAEQAAG